MILHFPSREEWLAWRVANKADFFGASEAAACAGVSPWDTPLELWKKKVGLTPYEDISDRERVKYGSDAEESITNLFALRFRGMFEVERHPYDIILDDKYPFIGATLDGYLTSTSEPMKIKSPTGYWGTINPGERGVYEGKTSLLQRKGDFENWDWQAPPYYFAQGCQQLYVTREWARYWIINAEVEIPNKWKEDGEWIDHPFYNKTETVRYVFFMDDPVVRKSITNVISSVVRMKRLVDARQMPETKIA